MCVKVRAYGIHSNTIERFDDIGNNDVTYFPTYKRSLVKHSWTRPLEKPQAYLTDVTSPEKSQHPERRPAVGLLQPTWPC